MKHAVRRAQSPIGGNWFAWQLTFRCPRCGQTSMRSFEVREDDTSESEYDLSVLNRMVKD